LNRLASDAQLRRNYGEAGRAHVNRNFDLRRNVAQLIALYEQ
jgi:glycosyltransferase involved in cell wall biosynthesis